MSVIDLAGQERAKQMLGNGLRNERISHAYIFHGPAGTGKEQMAIALAKAIFCIARTSVGFACGQCVECRRVDDRNHADLHWIEPDGRSIKIEQTRELQRVFAYRAHDRQAKVYIMKQAELMTPQAANSLLKFLEEPNSGIIAILLTENGQALLPTIRSRAQWIPFTPLVPQEIITVLLQEGLSETLVRPAAHLTSGIDSARELVKANWFAEIRNISVQLLKECFHQTETALLTLQRQIVKGDLLEHTDMMLHLFMLWFKDLIHVQCNRKQQIVFIDQLDWLGKLSFTRGSSEWMKRMERVVEQRRKLRMHANPQLALEQLLIAIGRR